MEGKTCASLARDPMALELESSFCPTVHRLPESPVSSVTDYGDTDTDRGTERQRQTEVEREPDTQRKPQKSFNKERQKYIQGKKDKEEKKQKEKHRNRLGERVGETGTKTEIRETGKESQGEREGR